MRLCIICRLVIVKYKILKNMLLLKHKRKTPSVFIDCERFLYTPSGLQYYAKNLVESLLLYSPYKLSLWGPYTIKDLPLKGRLRYSRLARYIRKIPVSISGYDLVHLTHQLSDVFDYISPKAKVVLTIHDLNPLYSANDDLPEESFIAGLRKNLSRADHVVTISQYVKDDLLKYADLLPELDTTKVSVIHNGLPFGDFPVSYRKESLPKELRDIPYIVSIGQTRPKKNLLPLIQMLSYLPERHLVLIVDWLGNEYAKVLKEEVSKLGLEDRVHFYCKIEEEFKHLLLHYSEAMCHPSLLEGFGYPPVECMWHGRPVFLSRLTALPEIGGEVAYYFNSFVPEKMADVYLRGMADFNNHLEERVASLKMRALLFSQEAMGKAYSELYRKLLNG